MPPQTGSPAAGGRDLSELAQRIGVSEATVVRFAQRDSHQIFIEPEGLQAHELYPNGISTSLPFDVQYELVRSMRGFENAHITRPGYAIEYDYVNPIQLKPTLETKRIAGLYLAGQINGTSGYEEAAAQGMWAGINAACRTPGRVAATCNNDILSAIDCEVREDAKR